MNNDTTLGGSQRDFPSTLWSQFLETPGRDGPSRQVAWERLAEGYWKPVYAYIRSRWAKTNEDAKDLTQDFFAWMIERDFPSRADPNRGRFRVFLKAALENFLRNELRDSRRIKRGGKNPVAALDDPACAPLLGVLVDPGGKDAPEVLEEVWKRELFGRATRILEEAYRREKEETYFRIFKDYYLDTVGPTSHEEMSARYSLSMTSVNNYLRHAKRRFRGILRDLVSETVTGPAELEEELRTLFGKDPE